MVTLSEISNMPKIYTEERLLCPICNKNSNFLYIVKHVDGKYYLLEMCPKCSVHCNDIKEISVKEAKNYPAPTK